MVNKKETKFDGCDCVAADWLTKEPPPCPTHNTLPTWKESKVVVAHMEPIKARKPKPQQTVTANIEPITIDKINFDKLSKYIESLNASQETPTRACLCPPVWHGVVPPPCPLHNPSPPTVTTTSTNFPQQPVTEPVLKAWECPRCGTMNAPWATKCDCKRT